VVKTQKEVDMREIYDASHRKPAAADQTLAEGQPSGPRDPNSPDTGPRKPPTLRKPGEEEPSAQHPTTSGPPPVKPNATPSNPNGACQTPTGACTGPTLPPPKQDPHI